MKTKYQAIAIGWPDHITPPDNFDVTIPDNVDEILAPLTSFLRRNELESVHANSGKWIDIFVPDEVYDKILDQLEGEDLKMQDFYLEVFQAGWIYFRIELGDLNTIWYEVEERK